MIYCRISEFIFQQFLLPRGVEEKYKSLFSYGLEVVLSTFINLMVLLVLSATLNIFTEMLCFFITFIPLRIYGGGAHASSHSKCLMFFTLCMIGSIAAGTIISQSNIYPMIVLPGVICCMFLQFRFSKDKRKNFRYNNQHLIKFAFPWIICLLAYTSLFAPLEPKYTVISVFGIYVQSISLLIK